MFKVGDKVRIVCGPMGVIVEVTEGVSYPYLVEVDGVLIIAYEERELTNV